MELSDWLPSLTTTGLLTIALGLGRNMIYTRLTKSVEHEFNKQLELVRSQMRESEERLKAELRISENEIAALRNGALSALASRQITLDKRRLEAVDQLWESVTALGQARGIASLLSTISFEQAAPVTEQDPKAREVFEMIGKTFDLTKLDLSGASRARPFLSPMLWATFAALQAIIMHGVMQWQILRSGLGNKDLMDSDAVSNLIKIALPHYTKYIDDHGATVYYNVLQALDEQLLVEIQKMLSGVETDKDGIVQAAEILKQSGIVNAQASENRAVF
ncbi:hypothetical protein ACO0LM_03480 [Undibacterium sp. Di26W]|uniref:hypothetical protein n=1 Tax=Undibacterium sp. Di26W TaxID=3413035 RepID=UPI003BF1983C